jgi:hypothetical protein
MAGEQSIIDTVKNFILTERCEKVFLQDFDFLDGMAKADHILIFMLSLSHVRQMLCLIDHLAGPCLKHIINKGLSIGIIAGSFLCMLPARI